MSLSELVNPEALIQYGGLVLLLLIIFAETGVFFGFFLPGIPCCLQQDCLLNHPTSTLQLPYLLSCL